MGIASTGWGKLAWGLGAPLEVPAYVVGVEGRPSEEEWNDRAVVFYRDLTMVEVRARLDAAVSAVLERARLRSDEQMSATDAIPWGGGRPLWEQIGGETFNHWPRPVEGIEAALRNRQQRR